MKTLRGLFSDLPLGGYDFLQEYGSWRVAEGEMVSKGDVWVNVVQGDGSKLPVAIGRRGAHVKLIIPPKEREGHALTEHEQRMFRRMREAEGQAQTAYREELTWRARVDKCERALREIGKADDEETAGLGAMVRLICRVASIAREALDD